MLVSQKRILDRYFTKLAVPLLVLYSSMSSTHWLLTEEDLETPEVSWTGEWPLRMELIGCTYFQDYTYMYILLMQKHDQVEQIDMKKCELVAVRTSVGYILFHSNRCGTP